MNNVVINPVYAGVISEAPRISEVLINVLSFLLSVLSIVAIIMTVVSAIMYMVSAGNEQRSYKAKRAFIYSAVGILAALSGLIIIRTIGSFFE